MANFINEVVDVLDLSEITSNYDNSKGGQAPFHPVMMAKLLIYGYCVGVFGSRKIERNTYEVIPFWAAETPAASFVKGGGTSRNGWTYANSAWQ